jgi:hypothetical protein
MLSAGHAALQTFIADHLMSLGWTVMPEVSFAYYSDRGSIDILAWHADSRTLLVIEIKTEIVDVPDLLHVADRKRRVAPRIARDRGLRPSQIATWLVVADSSVNRARARRFAALLRASFPVGTREMWKWVAQPTGTVGGLSFVSIYNPDGVKQRVTSRKRVRVPKGRQSKRDSEST